MQLQVDRVDEILEGYRTFTALAAEVSAPGGGGMMSRYGTPGTVVDSDDTQKDVMLTATANPEHRSETLSVYGGASRQPRREYARSNILDPDGLVYV